jgi:hypothetical protein
LLQRHFALEHILAANRLDLCHSDTVTSPAAANWDAKRLRLPIECCSQCHKVWRTYHESIG